MRVRPSLHNRAIGAVTFRRDKILSAVHISAMLMSSSMVIAPIASSHVIFNGSSPRCRSL